MKDDFDDLISTISLDENDSTNDVLENELAEAKKTIQKLTNKLDTAFSAVQGEAGKPLLIEINQIIENPDHPNTRKESDKAFEKMLTNNIKEQAAQGKQGVQDPISVHWSEKYNKWIINKGHTRHKCAKAAGLKSIPAIIQDDSTDWNQVIENILHKTLSTRDRVDFIQKKKAEGISQKDIAKSLSRDAGWVSKHMALVEPPIFIKALWDKDYATDFTILYGLVTLYKKSPETVENEVNKILSTKTAITKDDVNSIEKILSKKTADKELEDGNSTEPDDKTKKTKIKIITRLQVEYENSKAFLVLEEPSEPGRLVVELQSGQVCEAPIKDITILGVVSEEV